MGTCSWSGIAVSYISPNYDPLVESGQMTLLELAGVGATAAICPGISVELFPGHTAQMMGVHIESGERARVLHRRPAADGASPGCDVGDGLRPGSAAVY